MCNGVNKNVGTERLLMLSCVIRELLTAVMTYTV